MYVSKYIFILRPVTVNYCPIFLIPFPIPPPRLHMSIQHLVVYQWYQEGIKVNSSISTAVDCLYLVLIVQNTTRWHTVKVNKYTYDIINVKMHF